MNIRNATPADCEGIATVLKESYNIASIEEGSQVFQSERAKGHHYIVATEGEKVVGFTTWLMHGLYKHGLAELDRIAVLPEVRGRGVARQLFNALKEKAKEHYEKHNEKLRKLYLLTHANNKRAHAFYSKMGFSHETTLKGHYYKDLDEWVFSIFF